MALCEGIVMSHWPEAEQHLFPVVLWPFGNSRAQP